MTRARGRCEAASSAPRVRGTIFPPTAKRLHCKKVFNLELLSVVDYCSTSIFLAARAAQCSSLDRVVTLQKTHCTLPLCCALSVLCETQQFLRPVIFARGMQLVLF